MPRIGSEDFFASGPLVHFGCVIEDPVELDVVAARLASGQLRRDGFVAHLGLCAGVTRTPGIGAAEAAFPEVVQQLVSQHPMARMASEDEIAASALWLCSKDAGYVTGAALSVDGGFLAA